MQRLNTVSYTHLDVYKRQDKITPNDANLIVNGMHHQFIASAKTVIEGRKINPNFKFGCMIASNVVYPYTCKPEDVMKAWEVQQRTNYYCGDVMVRGEYAPFTKSYLKDLQATIHTLPEDDAILKEGVVDYYAFSYYTVSYTHLGIKNSRMLLKNINFECA